MNVVSVVVVNFNGSKYLRDCLAALRAQSLPPYRFEVILVDNASCDGSCDLVERDFPWVRLVRPRANLGFTGGNLLGVEKARGELVVLLNNDTVPDPFWLESLCDAADAHPEAALIASKAVFAGRPGVIHTTGLQVLRDGRGADRHYLQNDRGQAEAAGEVFAGCGVSLLVRRDAVGELFSRDFFMYYEDLELGWRVRLKGMSVRYCPQSLVRHVHGGSAGPTSDLFVFRTERNRALTALRHGSAVLAVMAIAGLAARAVRALLTRRRASPVWRALLSVAGRGPLTLLKRGAA